MRGASRGRGVGVAAGLLLAMGCAGYGLAQSVTTPPPVGDTVVPAAAAAATTSSPTTAGIPGPADVTQAEQAVTDSQQALTALQASIGISKDKADALRAEIAAMNGDQAKQDAALIAAGQRVKIAEIEVSSMRDRLSDLASAEDGIRGRLNGADASISNMLAALERISLNPPPALIVDPSDAVSSARSAILISAVVPQLRAKADQVVADLKRLQAIKGQALAEQDELNANYAVLQEEQLRIATLIAARKQSITGASTALTAEEQQAASMAQQAASLQQLVGELTAKANAVSEAASASSANPQLPKETPQAIRTAMADTTRQAPAIPFERARGYLTPPATGDDVQDFGAKDGLGGIAQGVSYITAPNAAVVAPADGWVIYKGPYLNYGQIVILNPGDGYTIVLAGLQDVSVNLGQFLLEGEPLGTMGSHTIGRTVATDAGVSRPTLYIELRKNDQPMDPTGWWAAPSNTTQSG